MDKEFSFNLIKAVHLNDAKHELGSGLDRHENIGFGHINKVVYAELLCKRYVNIKGHGRFFPYLLLRGREVRKVGHVRHINKGFRTFLLHDRIREKPMILETPYNPKLKPGEEIEIVRKMLG